MSLRVIVMAISVSGPNDRRHGKLRAWTGETNGDAARPTAFLSYARADQDRAAKLARALETAGVDLWWDTMIEGGAAFAKSIEAALENSNAVIVVWSAASVGSDWVLDEAAKGRDLQETGSGHIRRHRSAAGISPVPGD